MLTVQTEQLQAQLTITDVCPCRGTSSFVQLHTACWKPQHMTLLYVSLPRNVFFQCRTTISSYSQGQQQMLEETQGLIPSTSEKPTFGNFPSQRLHTDLHTSQSPILYKLLYYSFWTR